MILSPKATLNKYLNFEIPNYKRGMYRVVEQDFFVPKFEEHYLLLKNNYTIKQLKVICKKYNLPCTGNKLKLTTQVYNYLKFSNNIITLQACYRGYLIRKLQKLKGPALKQRDLCTNTTDFFTMEKINHISNQHFFSFKDSSDFIYGFNIISLYHLFTKEGRTLATNPYNREKFSSDVFNHIITILKLHKIIKNPIETNLEEESVTDVVKQLDLRILSLFQNIDALGNYTQHTWFSNLDRSQLIKLVKELYDIWHYRAQLSDQVKRQICPPIGDPFRGISIIHDFRTTATPNQLKRSTISIFEKMVNTGVDDANRNLGAFYVLSALTLVSPQAAEALPWLYQSVLHHNS